MKTKFKRIIIWGLKTQIHSHRFIHQAFYENARKLGFEAIWLDNAEKNRNVIKSGDLVISVGFAGDKLPIVKGANYCLHNFLGINNQIIDQIETSNFFHLQVFTTGIEQSSRKISSATYIDEKSRTLYQPWGTDLLKSEFKKPLHTNLGGISFWVGSVWNNEQNQGNTNEYAQLQKSLKLHNIRLVKARVPNWAAIKLIQISRIAPSVVGKWQAEHNYLPCRMFKNISYGQLGISNVKGFEEIFGDAYIYSDNIAELVDRSLSISKNERMEMIREQQRIIADHTYEQKLKNIISAFDILNSDIKV